MHPNNHYLTLEARIKLAYLAALYRVAFPSGPVLHLNDASLERGGLFDIKAREGAPWTTPHPTHRFGTEIDIRANQLSGAISEANYLVFEKLVREAGATRNPSRPNWPAYKDTSNQHYHVRCSPRKDPRKRIAGEQYEVGVAVRSAFGHAPAHAVKHCGRA